MNNTHMLRTLTLGVAAALSAVACSQDGDRDLDALAAAAPPIDLLDAAPGQQSRYERITLAAADTLATAARDTLVLALDRVDAATGALHVREYLTEHSASRTGPAAVAYAHEELTYELVAAPTELRLVGTSRLIASYAPDGQRLSYRGDDGAGRLVGDRIDADYLPLDRSLRLDDGVCTAELLHARRGEGLPGLSFVHDRRTGVSLALVEYDLAGNAEGWRRIEVER